MSKGIFITATGTDMGKTYITALIIKKLIDAGLRAGYYKAALSGADTIEESDAGYVNRIAGINQDKDTLVSYIYKNAVSPHLAAKTEGNPVEMPKVLADYKRVCEEYDYVTVEGSGGIVCPIRCDEKEQIMLEDIVEAFGLNVIIIADAGLGTINSVTLTAEYLKARNIGIKGVILNNYTDTAMQRDNIKMIEKINNIPVIALVKPDDKELDIDVKLLKNLYEQRS